MLHIPQVSIAHQIHFTAFYSRLWCSCICCWPVFVVVVITIHIFGAWRKSDRNASKIAIDLFNRKVVGDLERNSSLRCDLMPLERRIVKGRCRIPSTWARRTCRLRSRSVWPDSCSRSRSSVISSQDRWAIIKYLDVGPQAQLPPPYAEDISALLTLVSS